ncbi:MAG: hypothetical protein K8J31_18925 [Anaerolineae bacterium]|nr:hypothetical protein [Anaerolineae bacterium]
MRLLQPVVVVLLNLGLFVGIAGAVSLGAQVPTRQMVYDISLGGNREIVLLDVDHLVAYNLTQNEGEDIRPTWSPDGRKIAFESWRDGVRGVYVMDADGRHLRRLSVDSGASEYAPQWIEGGRAIIFRSYRRVAGGETTVTLYRVNPDGSHLQQIESDERYRVSHTDRFLSQRFVDGEWGIYVTEGDQTRQLRDGRVMFRENPQWSADDRLIAFLSQGTVSESEVYLMSADGASVWQITHDGKPKSNLSWRPS